MLLITNMWRNPYLSDRSTAFASHGDCLFWGGSLQLFALSGSARMAKALVIVESPAKAKTIGKYLGKDFIVESSIGHIRDLPSSADQIPEQYKKKPWSRTGVDVENGFTPLASATNFVAIDCGKDGAYAKSVLEKLIAADVFVRMPGLAPLNRCIRVSAGTEAELNTLTTALPAAR